MLKIIKLFDQSIIFLYIFGGEKPNKIVFFQISLVFLVKYSIIKTLPSIFIILFFLFRLA